MKKQENIFFKKMDLFFYRSFTNQKCISDGHAKNAKINAAVCVLL